MLIDLSQAIKIGNMTKGGGLAAAFDGLSTTVTYAEYASGYVGATLAEPKRIDKVEVTSADNGFDASGLTSNITLVLLGKTGTAPSNGLDGKILATLNFTDQNYTRTVTLNSSDKVTLFDHVWVRVVTGVWCIMSELKFYEAPEPEPVPEP